jgi:hypothetical protein
VSNAAPAVGECQRRPKLVDKSDARVELWIPRQVLLQPWHSDQDHADFSGVEDCSYLFETGHAEAVRFIDQNKRRRIADRQFFPGILLCDLTIRRMEFWDGFGQPVVVVQSFSLVLFVPLLNDVKLFFLLVSQWPFGQIPKGVARTPDIGLDASGRVHNRGRIENGV